MKKTLASLLLLLPLTSISYAQQWSAGFRTGIEQQEIRLSDKPLGKNNTLLQQQLYLSRKIGKRFEAEVALQYGHKNTTDSIRGLYDAPELIVLNRSIHSFSLAYTFRAFLYQSARWQAYAQAGFSSYYFWENFKGVAYQSVNPQGVIAQPSYFSGTDKLFSPLSKISLGAGANYQLYKSIYLNTQANIHYLVDRARYLTNQGNKSLSLSGYLGLGFRF